MFYYNGFKIVILNDGVIASDGSAKVKFPSLDAALEVLSQ
jgi:hypothetical protein